MKAPPLPDLAGIAWGPLTIEWWADVWASPMAPEFLPSDVHGLLKLAVLTNQFWETLDPKLLSEIRMQRGCYGLTPIDRRRLQWEIDRAEHGTQSGRAKS